MTAETRADGLYNAISGMGLRDPSQYTRINADMRLVQEEQSWFNDQYGICRKVTETIPYKMGYRWSEFTLEEGDDDALKKISNYLGSLEVFAQDPEPAIGVQSAFITAQNYANLTGNAAIVIFADDGQPMEQPINLKSLKRIEKLQVLDRWQICPNATKFPIEEFYISGYGWDLNNKSTRIHRDRVIWFRGSELSGYSLRSNQWCDQSELDPVIHAIRLFLTGIEGTGRMVSNWDIRVHSMSGLLEKLLDGGSETETAIAKRLQTNDLGASMWRSMAVDKDTESLSYLTHQAGGYSDLIGQLKAYFTASTRFPPSILFGEFATGLGAAGQEQESRMVWNEVCETEIFRKKWTDKLTRLLNLSMAVKSGPTNGKTIEGIGIRWNPVYTSTPSEQAELELSRSQLVSTYGSFDPAFVPMAIKSMYGGKEFNSNLTLPEEYVGYLETSMGNTIDQTLNPPEEAPTEESPVEGEEAPAEEFNYNEFEGQTDSFDHEDAKRELKKVGETKQVNGKNYRLNENKRWVRVKDETPAEKPKKERKPATKKLSKEAEQRVEAVVESAKKRGATKKKESVPNAEPKAKVKPKQAEKAEPKKTTSKAKSKPAEKTPSQKTGKEAKSTVQHKPFMTEAEATEYTKGSAWEGQIFYHGTNEKAAKSITTDGIDVAANKAAVFGQAFYMGGGDRGKSIAEHYAQESAGDSGEPKALGMKVLVKNPLVANKTDLLIEISKGKKEGKIQSEINFDDPDGIDASLNKLNKSVTDYFRAQGYDSIHVKDEDYFLAFDPKQVAIFESKKVKRDG